MRTLTVDDCPKLEAAAAWSYADAFSRNRGLISAAEQARLRGKRVAIAGMGGVGGIHLVTLARLGIGALPHCRPGSVRDRQLQSPAGGHRAGPGPAQGGGDGRPGPRHQPRAASCASSPKRSRRTTSPPSSTASDVLIDGIDFFALEARRLVYREARRRGIWAIMAGPLGFSTAWLVFDPRGMSLDDYFDFSRRPGPLEQVAAFAIGLAPRATHWHYMDLSRSTADRGADRRVGLACQLCAGVAAAEAVKILLGRGPVRAAPWNPSSSTPTGQVLRAGLSALGQSPSLAATSSAGCSRRLRQLSTGR